MGHWSPGSSSASQERCVAHSAWGSLHRGHVNVTYWLPKSLCPTEKDSNSRDSALLTPTRRGGSCRRGLSRKHSPWVEASTLPRLGFFTGVSKSKTGHLNIRVHSDVTLTGLFLKHPPASTSSCPNIISASGPFFPSPGSHFTALSVVSS